MTHCTTIACSSQRSCDLWEFVSRTISGCNVSGFFTLSSRHGKTRGPTHSITNYSRFSHSILVWQSFGSIRKQEIMLTCLQMRHRCLTGMQLLQGVPTTVSTQCGVRIIISHIWMYWSFSDKSRTFSLSRNVGWHPRR
jgi:hypothetical protein